MTRTVSPIVVTSDTFGLYNNVLNSFMDKGLTLYSGNYKRTRFPFTVKTKRFSKYNVTYTGTNP
jgi:hypothetical protein